MRINEKLKAGVKVSDIKKIYEKSIVPMGGKHKEFKYHTPSQIIIRLKQSKWLFLDRKDEYAKGHFGRIPTILKLGEKAENYLKIYSNFLDGPLCWKWREEKKEKENEKEVKKPAIIVEEIRVVER
jgi:hypothetical protein